LAAYAASMVALITADLLINLVIRLSGGRLAGREIVEVFAMSTLGAGMNTVLALVAVLVLTVRSDAAWIAFMPPIVLYLAYRAYVNQREERGRLQALYEATRLLHASPQIESALAAAATHARDMFDAEIAEITVFPGAIDGVAYRTTSGPGDRRDVMRPVAFGSEMPLWRRTLTAPEPTLLSHSVDGIHVDGVDSVKDAMMAPLVGSGGLVGAIVVANRLGDVSTFGSEDLRLLETVASQVSVSLENGRLEDSLAQLTMLKERLESLVRSKDEFVASVSHELRTPLTAVVGLAQELQANRTAFDDGELDELMAIIADQSSELSNIVEDLLVAARADIGTLNLHPVEVDVRAELDALVAAMVTRMHDGNPIPIHGAAREIVTDPLRFRQIIRNLLTNASRYGGDRVWIEASVADRTVTVAVLDDGLGVPDEAVEKIFEAYERAHNAATQPSSVGLGLAVSRQLARLMGGDLAYRRRDGATAFVLTLPIAGPTSPRRPEDSDRPGLVPSGGSSLS
jgi:signal transduction histidine kinase